MRTLEILQNKHDLFANSPATERNLAILAALDSAIAIRDDIDLATATAAAAVIPGNVLSVAPYDAWVWADGLSEHLNPDINLPRKEEQIEPTEEEKAGK